MPVNRFLYIFYLILFILSGCNTSYSDIGSYNQWTNDPSNGLVKEKSINGLTLQLKYLTVDQLIYRETSTLDLSQSEFDSLYSQYENSLTFLMTIDIDESTETTGDIMYYGVKNKAEFIEKALTLNFNMDEYISISTTDGSIYKPVLSNMENVYSVSTGRKFMFVFVPNEQGDNKLKTSEELLFTYNDREFDMGKVHFKFDRKTLTSIPKLNFNLKDI